MCTNDLSIACYAKIHTQYLWWMLFFGLLLYLAISYLDICPSSAATLYFFKVLYFIWTFVHFCTLFIHFLEKKAWNIFILHWKDFTSIFQDGDSRPYRVLLPSQIEEWSHLVNLLVRSTCTLALRIELESSPDTVASKVCIVIWNKVNHSEYPGVSIFNGNMKQSKPWWVSLIVLKILFKRYLVSKNTFLWVKYSTLFWPMACGSTAKPCPPMGKE